MTYRNYRQAVLRDAPTAFFPLGVRTPGLAASLYTNEAPRRVGGDLVNFSGTNASGALSPRCPMPDAQDPWVASGTDYMVSSAAANLNTADLTMEGWIYLTTAGTPGDVYAFGLAISGNPWTGVRYFSGNFEAFIGDTIGGSKDISRIPAIRGRWVHVCAAYNGTTRSLRFFADGVENSVQGSAGAGTRQQVSSQAYIGRYNATLNFPWPAGSGVCCVAFYDRFDPTMAGRHYRVARGRRPASRAA